MFTEDELKTIKLSLDRYLNFCLRMQRETNDAFWTMQISKTNVCRHTIDNYLEDK